MYNVKSKEWSIPKLFGNPPKPRSGHSSILVGSSIYIFGGSSKEGLLSDLFVIDLESRVWEEVFLEGPKPTPRTNHKACLDDEGRIVIYGGYTEMSYSNEVFFINLIEWRFEKP